VECICVEKARLANQTAREHFRTRRRQSWTFAFCMFVFVYKLTHHIVYLIKEMMWFCCMNASIVSKSVQKVLNFIRLVAQRVKILCVNLGFSPLKLKINILEKKTVCSAKFAGANWFVVKCICSRDTSPRVPRQIFNFVRALFGKRWIYFVPLYYIDALPFLTSRNSLRDEVELQFRFIIAFTMLAIANRVTSWL
jgi:hypothetical protein